MVRDARTLRRTREGAITAIRQFREGMRARVRTDDGEHSGLVRRRFGVTQGLRQGCALSPLLFKVFFAAVTDAPLRVPVSRTDIIYTRIILKVKPESRSRVSRVFRRNQTGSTSIYSGKNSGTRTTRFHQGSLTPSGCQCVRNYDVKAKRGS